MTDKGPVKNYKTPLEMELLGEEVGRRGDLWTQ